MLGLGFGVWGLGFRVAGLGFRVEGVNRDDSAVAVGIAAVVDVPPGVALETSGKCGYYGQDQQRERAFL